MKFISVLVWLIFGVSCLFPGRALASDVDASFNHWLSEFRIEALESGISQEVLNAAFSEVNSPLPRVLELDRNQPEFRQSLADYVKGRVTPLRVGNGQRMLQRYPTWLGRIEAKYAVPRQFILALWGIETNYGSHSGTFPIIRSLATLAHDGRRSSYFRRELMAALKILDEGHISVKRLKGSWAGAMGQCQFMPTSFLRYAVDIDGDGRVNIWGSIPDVLASTANYLKMVGWQSGQPWGYPVSVPKEMGVDPSGLEPGLPVERWQSLGVRLQDGRDLPQQDLVASLIEPDEAGGQYYLVFGNFRALLKWNNSNAFAIAVGTLADRLVNPKKDHN